MRPSFWSSDSILKSISSSSCWSVMGASSALQKSSPLDGRNAPRMLAGTSGGNRGLRRNAGQHQLFVGGDDCFLGQASSRPVPGAEAGQKGQDRKRRHLDSDDFEDAFGTSLRANSRQPLL